LSFGVKKVHKKMQDECRDVPFRKFDFIKLREYRKAAGLTTLRLAELAGVDQSIISHYEAGRKSPSIETLASIAAACKVMMDDLMMIVG